tara:strand:+ start:225 stop:638 length:414 start_codon:yes stop_codon:yes gene_type:complete
MKKVIKLTESKLISLIERVLNEGTVLKYSKPIPAEISKSLDIKRNGKSRQNVFKIVTNNTTRYYSIVGNTWVTGRDELNFKSISKKSNGDMVFNRFVKGGTDPKIISFSKMKAVLIGMSKGQQKINPTAGIYFNKIS